MTATLEVIDNADLYGFSDRDVQRIAYAVGVVERMRSPRSPPNALADRNYSRLRFRNDNATTAPAYAVMRVTGMVAVDAYPVLTCDQPDSTYRWLYFVNGVTDVAANAYGWGTWLWHADFALYDAASGTPAYGETWGPTASSWKLSKWHPGFFVLGGNDTGIAGSERTVGVQLPPAEILGKTDTSVTGGGTATVSVYAGTAGSESDTGQDVVSCYLRSGYVPASTFVKIAVSNGNPYILGDHRQVIGKADSTITKGSTGTFSIYNNETDTTDNITAKALGAQVTGAKWATAWQEEKSGTWYCGCWES